MSIIAADFQVRLSGGGSNSSGDASLGGVKSSNQIAETLNALFDAVSAAEALAGDVEYRAVYLHNANATDEMTNAVVYLDTVSSSADTDIAVGVGTSAIDGTEQTIANESTAPTGVTFSTPTDADSGLALGSLAAGEHKAIWIRRTVSATAANVTDTATLGFRCETV
jgi:hypothetical protein